MANFIGRLGVLLGLDSAEFTRGIQAASKQLDVFAEKAKVAATVGGAAFVGLTYKALEYADSIADTAKANDVAIDSILKLQNALANSGGEAENAGKLLSSFTATIDQAAQGSFEVQKRFQSLGITLTDLRNLSIDELFNKAVGSLANMQDAVTRNATAMQLFGKAAKGVDFLSLNDEIRNGAGVNAAQAKAVKDAADAYDKLAQSTRDFSLVLVEQLGPPLLATLDYLKSIKGDASLVGSVFRTAFQTIAVLGANVAFVFEGIAAEIGHTIENAKLLAKLDIQGAIAANQAYDARMSKRRAELDAFEQRIMAEPTGGGYGGGISNFDDPRRIDRATSPAAPMRSVKPGVDKEWEAEMKKRQALILKGFQVEQEMLEENRRLIYEQADAYQRAYINEQERVKQADKLLDRERVMMELANMEKHMRPEQFQHEQEMLRIYYQQQDAIERIKNDEKLDNEARAYALEQENRLAAKAYDLANDRLRLAKEAREGTLTHGFFNAMADAARNATTEFERGQVVFESMMGNMESAINKFVQTGKFSFKDLARSIIADMIAIQMKAQLLGIFGSLLPTRTPSIGIPGGMSPETLALAGYADGGSPAVGVPSIVGERGPELFVPRTAGTIIPNNQLSSALGGPVVNYNGPYIANMSAIDTQSATQFLSKNRQAVWSANQSAQRSLPVSR